MLVNDSSSGIFLASSVSDVLLVYKDHLFNLPNLVHVLLVGTQRFMFTLVRVAVGSSFVIFEGVES